MTAVGGFGYLQLLDDYSRASSLLLASVEELKGTTNQVSSRPSAATEPFLTLSKPLGEILLCGHTEFSFRRQSRWHLISNA